MKTHILNYEPNRTGGGWTQSRYLYEGLEAVPYEEADIVIVTGPTMANRTEVEQAKKDGKKIVFRIDNAVRNSRNRGTGMSRMKDFSDMADLVIYQSKWARDFLYPFTKKDGAVILNGVDTSVYNSDNRRDEDHTYLYARSSRDEGKQWINAWYWYVDHFAKHPESHFEIAGKFSSDNFQYNFDFYNGEKYTFIGQQPNLIDSYKRNKYFLYSFTNDACSNSLLEARASGCEIVDVFNALSTGGAPEIMACKDISVERMISQYKVTIGRL